MKIGDVCHTKGMDISMNIIKKYWDSVYIYVLLLVPGLCICAGTYWTICKLIGLYPNLQWRQIILFDLTQLIYLSVGLYFIFQNKKDNSYISEHLIYIKGFITFSLFIQYNFILYLFASVHVWICTFIFYSCIAFLFDSKFMNLNIMLYTFSLLVAHILRPEAFLPFEDAGLYELIAYRIIIFALTTLCFMIIVYFVERFLLQARENNEENVQLMEKQLKYYKDMELLDKEIRKFRHDIKNHFICMESLLKSGNEEGLQQYFQDLQQSFSFSFQEKIYFSGNDIVDAILHHDLSYQCNKVVNVSVYGILPEIKTVSAIDLCTLFSNLLSNAISSANQCIGIVEPQIIIRFSGGRTYFSITMTNSFSSQSYEQKKKKDRNHGHGIPKISTVLEKYDGRLEQNVERNLVTITIYLPI